MTALDEFVRDTAARYLQSVVFVDDKIYVHQLPQDYEKIPIGSFSGLKSQFADETIDHEVIPENNEEQVAATEVPERENHKDKQAGAVEGPEAFHPRDLMESFARYGIVCALYEPKEAFKSDPASDLFLLCERADVVILDWDLYGDDGDGVSALLANLIKKSASDLPHHVRFCTLYTDRPSLYPIMERLLENLEHQGCSVIVADEKLQLISGATRISVFGKPQTVGRPPVDKPYEVEETDLANRVISEFANLHHGLMPAFALHGLASVRKNTKRLLDRFVAKLDGPFLLHRALLLADHDAFDELPELLSDEILAVLQDTRIDVAAIAPIASATIQHLPIAKAENLAALTDLEDAALDYDSIFRDLLLGGEKKFRAAVSKRAA